MQIETFSALQGVDPATIGNYLCAVIDVIRASTTILCLMEHGAEEIQVVATVEEALALKLRGYTPIGERGNLPLPGFTDNSPYLVSQHDWRSRRVVLTTSNGTRALVAVRDARQIVVAAFRNLEAVARRLRADPGPIGLVPIGSLGHPSYEDEACADALRRRLLGERVDFEAIRRKIFHDRAAQIERKGCQFRHDIELALTLDATAIIPVLAPGLVLRPTSFPR